MYKNLVTQTNKVLREKYNTLPPADLVKSPHLLREEISRLNESGMEPERIYEHLKKIVSRDLVPSLIPEINKVIKSSVIKEYTEYDNLPNDEFALPNIRRFPVDTKEHAKTSLNDVKRYPNDEKYKKYVYNAVFQRYPELYDDMIRDMIRQDPNADDDKIYKIISKDTKLFSDTYVIERIRIIRSEMGLSDYQKIATNRYTDGGISPFQ